MKNINTNEKETINKVKVASCKLANLKLTTYTYIRVRC